MQSTLHYLEKLVAFPTVSRDSNLDLIDFVARELKALGIASTLIHNEDGKKANLWATIGPANVQGVALSGHTDVVPVEGQNWSSDPFTLTSRGGNLYGRGSADMKGFIASCLHACIHARELERLTGLVALEGQARLLINDVREHQAWLELSRGRTVPMEEAAEIWLADVLEPSIAKLAPAIGPGRDPIQAYCDVLEQKWLLSEAAGRDVGLEAALEAYLALGAPAPEDTVPDSPMALDIDWSGARDRGSSARGAKTARRGRRLSPFPPCKPRGWSRPVPSSGFAAWSSATATSAPSTGSTSTSHRGRSSDSSGRTAPARRRPWRSSRAWVPDGGQAIVRASTSRRAPTRSSRASGSASRPRTCTRS